MEINFTLVGQLITFSVLVFFTMKYVWPPIIKAMNEREKRIAEGLAAGERGHKDLELAQQKAISILQEAKQESNRIVDNANKRAAEIIEAGKETARQESARILQTAKNDIEQMTHQAKIDLQHKTSELAITMAEKILHRDIDATMHRKLLDQFVTEI